MSKCGDITVTISSAKVSAANALARKPASVIHICIVAKNPLELSNNFLIFLDFIYQYYITKY